MHRKGLILQSPLNSSPTATSYPRQWHLAVTMGTRHLLWWPGFESWFRRSRYSTSHPLVSGQGTNGIQTSLQYGGLHNIIIAENQSVQQKSCSQIATALQLTMTSHWYLIDVNWKTFATQDSSLTLVAQSSFTRAAHAQGGAVDVGFSPWC